LLPTTLTSEESSDIDYMSSSEDSSVISHKLKAGKYNSNSSASVNRKRRKITWKVIGFTECSKTCGGGIHQPIIRCTRGESTKSLSPKKCAHLQKPTLNENLTKCNSQPCPAFWRLGDWSKCRCGESHEKLNQTREIKCVQELISGVVIQVNSGACIDERPVSLLPCACTKTTKTTLKNEINKYNRLSSIVHQNTQNDQKAVSKGKSKAIKSKKSGIWLTSDWSTCSTECGVGQQFRTIFCERNPPNTERCDIRLTPNIYRECTSNVKCFGEWFIGEFRYDYSS
jgi:thrombospondin type-1 domain-containing protein 4